MKVESVILEDKYVRLEPLKIDHSINFVKSVFTNHSGVGRPGKLKVLTR